MRAGRIGRRMAAAEGVGRGGGGLKRYAGRETRREPYTRRASRPLVLRSQKSALDVDEALHDHGLRP